MRLVFAVVGAGEEEEGDEDVDEDEEKIVIRDSCRSLKVWGSDSDGSDSLDATAVNPLAHSLLFHSGTWIQTQKLTYLHNLSKSPSRISPTASDDTSTAPLPLLSTPEYSVSSIAPQRQMYREPKLLG